MGKLPGSLCAVTALPHAQKISFPLPPSPTYRYLPTYLLRSGFPPDSKTGAPCAEIPRSERSRAGLGAGGPPPPPPVGSGHPPWEMVLLFPPTRQTSIIFVLLVLRSGTGNPCPRAPSSEMCPSKKTMLQKPSMTFRVGHRAALESNSSF